MTKAQAQTVVSDLVNAGYDARVAKLSDGSFQVSANDTAGATDVAAVSAFATSHSVIATVSEVIFS